MRLHLIPFFFLMIVFCCCKDKPKDRIKYAPRGSISVFDALSGKYLISSEDKKLISTWESFREAMAKSDYKTMKSLSLDSIICFVEMSMAEISLQEGTIGTLTFIETKNTYKFVGFFTIP